MRTLLTFRIAALLVALWTTPAQAQHAGDMLVGSSAAGGGALVIDYDFGAKILATPNVIPGFFSTTDPGFDVVLQAGSGAFPLASGTTVTVEITAIADGAQMQIDGTTLDGVGDRAVIGTMPTIHTHPQWQLILQQGASGDFPVAFRLTADSGTYAASLTYAAIITNIEGGPATATPTPALDATTTPTPAPTATPGEGRLCGDADASGRITVTDGVNVLRAAAGLSSACTDPAPCDVDGNGAVTVTDGVNVLRAAAGLAANLQCFDLE